MRDNEELVEFDDIFCRRDTPIAILVRVEGQEVWIPKSQIHADSEVFAAGTDGKLIISQWIAEKKGLV